MEGREREYTFLDYWDGNRDMIRWSMNLWLYYYDRDSYEQVRESGEAPILDLVEDVASELEVKGENLAETTRSGGLIVHQIITTEGQIGFPNVPELATYKDFLGLVSGTIDIGNSAKTSLIIAQGVIQDKIDEMSERIFPNRNKPATPAQQ